MFICWELGISNVILERECLKVVKAAMLTMLPKNELRPIFHGIHYMMHKAQNWKVQFNHRDTNNFAHCLAKIACKNSFQMLSQMLYL